MALTLTAKCGDCSQVQTVAIGPATKELTCTLCGRKIQSLSKDDYAEATKTLNTQRVMAAVAVVLFMGSIFCLMTSLGWMDENKIRAWSTASKERSYDSAMFFGTIALGVASAVFAALASRKRFYVEL